MGKNEPPEKFTQAIGRLMENKEPITIQMSRWQAWCLVGATQLASRHPGFNGPTRLVAESVAREISEALTANDVDLRQLALMGWGKQFDEKIIFDGKRYKISSDGKLITCLVCGITSSNPNDIANRYCGNCHVFHERL